MRPLLHVSIVVRYLDLSDRYLLGVVVFHTKKQSFLLRGMRFILSCLPDDPSLLLLGQLLLLPLLVDFREFSHSAF